MRHPRVDILYFEGCPNHEPARALVERLAAQLRIEPEIRLVEVSGPDAAVALRFLGSPTVRVDGVDVEPGAEARSDFALSCRIYRSENGVAEQPEERWVRDALAGRLAPALAAARIPPSKLGAARHAHLSEAQRELYFWILRRFATDGRPGSGDVRTAAEQLGLDAEEALETLSHEDLVHRGADGAIAVAYPFSGRPTTHHVRFSSGHEVDAMCAIDALGIAPMFGERIVVHSRDPVSGEDVQARVAPDGAAEWSPEAAVVVAGAISNHADACCGCCPVLNFFASATNAEEWLVGHPDVQGTVISIPDAAVAGQTVFGDVLAEA